MKFWWNKEQPSVQMGLATHTGYPEGFELPNGHYRATIHAQNGETLESTDQCMNKQDYKDWVQKVQHKYLKGAA